MSKTTAISVDAKAGSGAADALGRAESAGHSRLRGRRLVPCRSAVACSSRRQREPPPLCTVYDTCDQSTGDIYQGASL